MQALGGAKDHPGSVRHPYLRLLKFYLDHFLPRGQPIRNEVPSRGNFQYKYTETLILRITTCGLFVYMVSMLACHAREPGSIPGQTASE